MSHLHNDNNRYIHFINTHILPKCSSVLQKNDGDHQYDDIRIQDKQTNAVSTLYSTVNPPAEQLHYASINIHSGESAGNDKNASSDSNNSFEGAANPPAETTLYSTVAKLGE